MLERLLSDVTPEVGRILDDTLSGREPSRGDALRLLRAEGPDFRALVSAADVARREDNGDDVSFVINRNINFTNVCYVGCSFCGFSRHADDHDAYDRSMEEILEKCRDAIARGATEVCIQGGIDPKKDHDHYHLILTTIKAAYPELHIHAFSPEELDFGQKKSGMPLPEYLRWLKEAGLGTIPGTAAEILDDSVRDVLSPKKLKTARWVEIVSAAHAVGLRSSATIMYGHIERPEHVAAHMDLLREPPEGDGRLHRVRAARLHPREEPARQRRLLAAGPLGGGRPAPDRGRAPVPPALDPERTDVVGEDGPEARAALAHGGRERLRRHADGGVDQPRVRRGPRREPCRPR